ncbi:MAG TPA: TIGR02996 domain-containing protein [Gemmataceae bacterium]|jgi:uncharacterized protein (TIGR02996 family)|nr:TIGR02996 domain-containing protein [Gemmataceae bacterium]
MSAVPFLATIRAAPDDDAPRLVYADWLDEHGDGARAEFIRVQCELARRQSPALRAREADLLYRYHDAFAGRMASPGFRFRFERGFVTAFGHTGVFMRAIPPRRPGASPVVDFRDQLPRYHLLRFDLRGQVEGAFSRFDPRTSDHEVFPPPADTNVGTYVLDALAPVPELQFVLTDSRGTIDYRGRLEWGVLQVERFIRVNDRNDRLRYFHVHTETGGDSDAWLGPTVPS